MISQSLIKEIWSESPCDYRIKLMLNGEQSEPSLSMLYGLYFEHHLIGGTRDGSEPKLPTLKSGKLTKAQEDLDALVVQAKNAMDGHNIVIEECQPFYKWEDVSGHLDFVGTFDDEKAIFDVKWTATKETDRFHGWGDISNKFSAKLQATHYVYLYMMCKGKHVPFYFLIFGNSGWMKFAKFEISAHELKEHEKTISIAQNKLFDMELNGFNPSPHRNKCRSCYFKNSCSFKSDLPIIEKFTI